jgi:hypothetical protein
MLQKFYHIVLQFSVCNPPSPPDFGLTLLNQSIQFRRVLYGCNAAGAGCLGDQTILFFFYFVEHEASLFVSSLNNGPTFICWCNLMRKKAKV